jgi:hypothetical protein
MSTNYIILGGIGIGFNEIGILGVIILSLFYFGILLFVLFSIRTIYRCFLKRKN